MKFSYIILTLSEPFLKVVFAVSIVGLFIVFRLFYSVVHHIGSFDFIENINLVNH